MEDACKFMVKHRRSFKEKFSRDNLFGYRYMHALNQHFQRFLEACTNSDSIGDVDNSFFDMSHISQSVIHLKFSCDLPSFFTESSTSIQDSKKSKGSDSSPSPKKDSERYEKNESAKPEWILSKSTKLTDVFSSEVQKQAPKFNDECLCCVRWASKGYCFITCKNKASHCRWPSALESAHDSWQKQIRQA